MLKVTMLGTGYVGLVSGTCFAELGHQVTCLDIDSKKIDLLKSGVSPIYEPGLSDLLKRNIESERLHFTMDKSCISGADLVFLAVGTPTGENGEADLTYIFEAARDVASHLDDGCTVVIKSTVPVGTFSKIKTIMKDHTPKNFDIVSNPEFLKEGAAIEDFMKPDRIVVGHDGEDSLEKMRELYRPITDNGFPLYEMSNSSAEMAKYAANCFLATKISFINEIANLCDIVGANIDEVRQGIISDPRIGKYFLNPGAGYGGSCFPKDVKALIHLAKENDIEFKIVQAADDVNDEQRDLIAKKVLENFNGNIQGKKIAIWGLAFKPETDDIREAPAKYIIDFLVKNGAAVSCYDPIANDNFQEYIQTQTHLSGQVEILKNKEECLNKSEALILVTDWSEFKAPDLDAMKQKMEQAKIFDARNIYVREVLEKKGFYYEGIGRG